MEDLDKKLLEAVYKGVSVKKLKDIPSNSTNWFKATENGDVYEFVIDPEPIKQAFIDAGYRPDFDKDVFYQEKLKVIAEANGYIKVPKDVEETWRVYNEAAGFMTGKEWYEKFEHELSNTFFETWHERNKPNEAHEILDRELVLDTAKRASGVE